MTPEAALERFNELVPQFETVKDDLRANIEAVLRQLGLTEPYVRLDCRVKKPGSFMVKVVERSEEYQPDPLAAMVDKVGLRVELLFHEDLDRVVGALQDGSERGNIEIVNVEEKTPAANELGYRAVHIDLRPTELPPLLNPAYAISELQIRTMANGLWSQASHAVDYKPLVELHDDQKRRVRRLTVLAELFDQEVSTVRQEIINDERYPIARLLDTLRVVRARLGRTLPSLPEVTERIVLELLGDRDPIAVADEVETWSQEDAVSSKLKDTMSRYEGTSRQFYADRPEGLLAFYLLDTAKHAVRQEWIESGRNLEFLNQLAAAWGVDIPEPA